MGVLRDLLPPDETIVWISTPNSATARRRATIGVLAGICAVCAAAIALALVVTREPLAGAAFLGLLGILALLFAYELSETEIAVLSDHVVWNETGRLGRRL